MTENSSSTFRDDRHMDDEAAQAIALQRLIQELLPLRPEDRRKVLATLGTFFGSTTSSTPSPPTAGTAPSIATTRPPFQFSEDPQSQSPKAFMMAKAPQTDVERVACLAYYLSHFRGVTHVKTKDITALNTESAHKPFSNTAFAVDNATKSGYLVPSVKGSKQISAIGERFVEALPDRDAAKSILDQHRRPSGKKAPPT